MTESNTVQICKSCGFEGSEKYCSRCSQPYTVKRITISGLLHDAFHLLTHLDKGFVYTLKTLVVSPGNMQRSYIEGKRGNHQKPLSMFFVCATIAAISRYWVFTVLLRYYHIGSMSEANFSHAYMVIFQIALVPLYTLITYVFFYKTRYNYAEIGVLILYTISMVFLVAALTVVLKFVWPNMDTAYIEYPIFILYNTITFLNFFENIPRWEVVIKSILIVTVIFMTIQKFEDIIIGVISKSAAH